MEGPDDLNANIKKRIIRELVNAMTKHIEEFDPQEHFDGEAEKAFALAIWNDSIHAEVIDSLSIFE